jgi:hypothetical protein
MPYPTPRPFVETPSSESNQRTPDSDAGERHPHHAFTYSAPAFSLPTHSCFATAPYQPPSSPSLSTPLPCTLAAGQSSKNELKSERGRTIHKHSAQLGRMRRAKEFAYQKKIQDLEVFCKGRGIIAAMLACLSLLLCSPLLNSG